MSDFLDGLKNVFNSIINQRSGLNTNIVQSCAIGDEQLNAVYKTGLGNKIIRLKAGHALNDNLQFESKADLSLYNSKLDAHIKMAAKWMLAFGRGVIVIIEKDADLRRPLPKQIDPSATTLRVFSGDMVYPGNVSLDLLNERYQKPLEYNINGHPIHWTRVVDFTYAQPVERDLATYKYGGISEFELIYSQIINDAIVERAASTIIDRNSSFIYKIKGFKDLMRQKKDAEVIEYFSRVESSRSIMGATVLDSDDEADTVSQTLADLDKVDQITLRRLSMVTGIPLALLVGENVKGLNSTGDNERQAFQDMIEALQADYLAVPIRRLCRVFGIDNVKWKENQGETPSIRLDYETKVIANASALRDMGENYISYLREHGLQKPDEWEMFEIDEELSDGNSVI